MKNILLLIISLIIISCGRKKIGDINNCVIIRQYCGFDNLDGGYYHVKDLTTQRIYRIDVDIMDCKVYNVGDTIKK